MIKNNPGTFREPTGLRFCRDKRKRNRHKGTLGRKVASGPQHIRWGRKCSFTS